MHNINKTLLASLLGAALIAPAQAIVIDDWTGIGTFGVSGADGVVGLAPVAGSTQYGWVSTANSDEYGLGLASVGVGTNGSKIVSNLFSANAGDEFRFYFNYVTSDGSGYADYGWARLLNEDMTEAALLFTARTTPGGDTVPGFDMPAPEATLLPDSTPIIGGAPEWSPLGGYSNTCYSSGCGYTGWILASYDIPTAANYYLEIGVVNWGDEIYHSGMAFDGATIAGIDISLPVPEPVALTLLGVGLLGMWAGRRRLNTTA